SYTGPIMKGVASVKVSGLAGTVTAAVSYAGDAKYNAASASVVIVVNPKPKENATISIDAPEITEGESATVTVTLPNDATGTVTATVGGKTYTAPVKNGAATLIIPDLAKGDYTIPVTYSGDDKYNTVTKEVTINVKEDTSDKINAPAVTKYYKGSEKFVVTVTNYKGNPLANKEVKININGRNYTRTTDEKGIATMALGLPSNVYNVTVTVDNQTVKSVVNILPTVNGTDVVKMFRNGTQYYATFRDSQGKYLADGTAVQFNINGVLYNRQVSGDKGLARLNLNLPQGKYIITAINPETGENAANNITVLSKLVENRNIIKYFKNSTQYTVKVLGDNGKPVGAGVDVKFNINGVFYTRQTNASGIAKLSINLAPGDYQITAEFGGCKVANTVKVLPVLSATDIKMKYRDGTQFVAKLVDGQGKPYANQTVQFNINGVFYKKVTDASGQAKLKINLLAGEYIITSTYNGANIANKVTVTA
ncbi:Ig-like domain repeat protein, partial [Methanobrevibacter sp.]|uniref:Ig-like domain repeat protein n=1 Tax=Methanobrevibacter sp. TaxID=66852 RepID=UPI002E799B85